MNEKPFHNEPGFVKQIGGWEVESYNDVVRHETLRVAVCDALERENYPKEHMYVLNTELSFCRFMKYSCKIVWFMEFYLHVTKEFISVVLVNYTKIRFSKVL